MTTEYEEDEHSPRRAAIGKRYRIRFSDCCIEGSFEAVLTELVFKVPDVDKYGIFENDIEKVVFGNGVTITTGRDIVSFEEVK